MQKAFTLILFLLSATSQADTLSVQFEKICAYPDDAVIDTVDFYLSATSEMTDPVASPLMKLHAGKCFKAEKNSLYRIEIPFTDIGEPLTLQIAQKGLLFSSLGNTKVIIGSSRQLRHQDCSNPDHQCLDMTKLQDGERIVLERKAEFVIMNLKVIPSPPRQP